MWFFTGPKPEPEKEFKRETTFLFSKIVNGSAVIVEAGIQEDETGYYQVWHAMDFYQGKQYCYPRQSYSNRERAIQLAEILGKAHQDFVELNLAPYPKDDSDDRSE